MQSSQAFDGFVSIFVGLVTLLPHILIYSVFVLNGVPRLSHARNVNRALPALYAFGILTAGLTAIARSLFLEIGFKHAVTTPQLISWVCFVVFGLAQTLALSFWPLFVKRVVIGPKGGKQLIIPVHSGRSIVFLLLASAFGIVEFLLLVFASVNTTTTYVTESYIPFLFAIAYILYHIVAVIYIGIEAPKPDAMELHKDKINEDTESRNCRCL